MLISRTFQWATILPVDHSNVPLVNRSIDQSAQVTTGTEHIFHCPMVLFGKTMALYCYSTIKLNPLQILSET